MILQNVPALRHILPDAAISGNKTSHTDSGKPLSDKELNTIAAKLKLGRWNFYGALYSPNPFCEGCWLSSREEFSATPGAKFIFLKRPQNIQSCGKGNIDFKA